MKTKKANSKKLVVATRIMLGLSTLLLAQCTDMNPLQALSSVNSKRSLVQKIKVKQQDFSGLTRGSAAQKKQSKKKSSSGSFFLQSSKNTVKDSGIIVSDIDCAEQGFEGAGMDFDVDIWIDGKQATAERAPLDEGCSKINVRLDNLTTDTEHEFFFRIYGSVDGGEGHCFKQCSQRFKLSSDSEAGETLESEPTCKICRKNGIRTSGFGLCLDGECDSPDGVDCTGEPEIPAGQATETIGGGSSSSGTPGEVVRGGGDPSSNSLEGVNETFATTFGGSDRFSCGNPPEAIDQFRKNNPGLYFVALSDESYSQDACGRLVDIKVKGECVNADIDVGNCEASRFDSPKEIQAIIIDRCPDLDKCVATDGPGSGNHNTYGHLDLGPANEAIENLGNKANYDIEWSFSDDTYKPSAHISRSKSDSGYGRVGILNPGGVKSVSFDGGKTWVEPNKDSTQNEVELPREIMTGGSYNGSTLASGVSIIVKEANGNEVEMVIKSDLDKAYTPRTPEAFGNENIFEAEVL